MTPVTEHTSQAAFPAAAFPAAAQRLPAAADQPAYLERVLAHLRAAANTPVQRVLDTTLGVPADAATLGVAGLHHVATYLGDWRLIEDVERWLDTMRAHPGVRELRWGPSHIAPREYGTPGYWINFTLDGAEYELFTCQAQRSGRWAGLSPAARATAMSHFAVAVTGPGRVRPVLEFLSSIDGLDLLSYAPADELGHTYGHVVNRATGRVLEVVSSGPGVEAAKNRTALSPVAG